MEQWLKYCFDFMSEFVPGDQAHLRVVLGTVLRPPPRPPQEQLDAQVGLKNHDRNFARKIDLLHRGQVRKSCNHTR